MPTQKSSVSYELRNALALSIIPNIGDAMAKNLISYCGGVDAVFQENQTALSKIPGIGTIRAASVKKFKNWEAVEKEIQFIEKYDIETILYLDKAYPYRLKAHGDSPILLFKRGEANLNAERMVSIVGTRNITSYGRGFIAELAEGLAEYKVSITSGLAHGVDTAAHKAALKNNLPTIGVLGHGFATIYPAQNKNLAEEMAYGNGALLTDYFSSVPGNPENFPSRNRIVAGLCDALIVVESAYKGGSMITAEIANGYDKTTFALPGNTQNKYSQGCNLLIKLNKANLIENIGDLVYHLNWDQRVIVKKLQALLFEELSDNEKMVVSALQKENTTIDQLYYDTKIPMGKLSLILLDLELKNQVKVLPGKVFGLI